MWVARVITKVQIGNSMHENARQHFTKLVATSAFFKKFKPWRCLSVHFTTKPPRTTLMSYKNQSITLLIYWHENVDYKTPCIYMYPLTPWFVTQGSVGMALHSMLICDNEIWIGSKRQLNSCHACRSRLVWWSLCVFFVWVVSRVPWSCAVKEPLMLSESDKRWYIIWMSYCWSRWVHYSVMWIRVIMTWLDIMLQRSVVLNNYQKPNVTCMQ